MHDGTDGLVNAAYLKQRRLDAWKEVTGAEGIEPTVEVFEGVSGSD